MVTPGQLNRRAALFEQLAAMIAAGVPLPKAMEMVARNRTTGIPQKVLQELTRHLQDGQTFTDAMLLVSGQKQGIDVTIKPRREYGLSDFDVAMLSASEEAGQLDSAFRLLARYYAGRAKIIRDTIASLIITIVTLHVFLIVFPVPYLVNFFWGFVNGQYSRCWPFIIEKTLVFGALYGTVWFLMFASQGNRGEKWRALVESVFGLVPLLRTGIKYLAVARLAMALNALLNAGVPVIRAWELAAAASGSPHLKRQLLRWTPELETGVTPGDMVAQIGYFPEMFMHLYQTGEISGKLDDSLTRMHTYFEEEGFRKLQAFGRVLSFTIYGIVAIAIAVYVIHFWMGYYGALFNNI